MDLSGCFRNMIGFHFPELIFGTESKHKCYDACLGLIFGTYFWKKRF